MLAGSCLLTGDKLPLMLPNGWYLYRGLCTCTFVGRRVAHVGLFPDARDGVHMGQFEALACTETSFHVRCARPIVRPRGCFPTGKPACTLCGSGKLYLNVRHLQIGELPKMGQEDLRQILLLFSLTLTGVPQKTIKPRISLGARLVHRTGLLDLFCFWLPRASKRKPTSNTTVPTCRRFAFFFKGMKLKGLIWRRLISRQKCPLTPLEQIGCMGASSLMLINTLESRTGFSGSISGSTVAEPT